MSLHKKMATGIFWSILEKGGRQFVSFLIFMLIARMIGPQSYGTAMICFVFLAFCSLLFNGIGDGIITLQIKDSTKLSSMFWVITGLGLLISFGCFLCADILANFFEEPDIGILLKWFCIIPFLLAVHTIPHMLFIQRMKFKICALRSLLATVTSGAVGIYMAYNGYGPLSLIFQQIVLYIVANAVLWHLLCWIPSLCISKSGIIETLTPGIKMMISNIFIFLEQQAPRIFIAGFLGANSVGYYVFAFSMYTALQNIIIVPAFAVLFPALSQIKGQRERQDEIIGRMFLLIGLLVFPTITGAIFIAPLYIPLLFGDKWLPVLEILQVFMIMGYLAPFMKMAEIIFRAYNKVGNFLWGQGFITGAGMCLVYYYSQFDLRAVVVSIITYSLIATIIYFILLKRFSNINLWNYLSHIRKSTLSTFIMGAVIIFFINNVHINDEWMKLTATVLAGVLSYLFLCFLLQRNDILETIKHLRDN